MDDDWINAKDALELVEQEYSSPKTLIVARCRLGLIDSKAALASASIKPPNNNSWFDKLLRQKKRSNQEIQTENVILPREFWQEGFETDDDDELKTKKPHPIFDYDAIWELGEFCFVTRDNLSKAEKAIKEKMYAYETYYYCSGVQFRKSQLALFLKNMEHKLLLAPAQHITSRATSYNWEQALADLAGWIYHDADIINPNARGVQKQIEQAMEQSFIDRKLAVPSEKSIQVKARMVMAALRAK